MWSRLPKIIALLCCSLLFVAACGGEEVKPAALGEKCDTSQDKPCEGNGVCLEDDGGTNRCYRPLGSGCDPEADNAHCAPASDCFEVESDDDEPAGQCLSTESGECDPDEPLCAPHLSCAELDDGSNACHRPVYIEGMVTDSTDESPIEGAHIIALDERKVAVTDVAVSDEDGNYQLEVPVVRQEDGSPVDSSFTLRADAADYQTFPSGIRTALPINTSTVEDTDGGWKLSGTPTDIVLIPLLDNEQGNSSISGSILADKGAGVLVIAEGATAHSAISDRDGDYTIFNVPDGSFEVHGYAAGLQLQPEQVSVAGEPLEDVDLSESDQALVDVHGSINMVRPGDGEFTSVVLAVASTFEILEMDGDQIVDGRGGEVPRGLRAPESGAPDVSNEWTITGVPAGDYVVLAAFENDHLVRNPNRNEAGTHIVQLTVDPAAGDTEINLGESFKVRGALAVEQPGADGPEGLTEPPTLIWEDTSSEEYYIVEVFDAYGNLVWSQTVDSVSGSDTVEVDYEGDFESGIYYQFRAAAWKEPNGKQPTPITTTEDLKGVFFAE